MLQILPATRSLRLTWAPLELLSAEEWEVMKWMIVVVVLGGTAPVKTGLLYEDLDACWAATDLIMAEYGRVAKARLDSASANQTEQEFKVSRDYIMSRLTTNSVTCIPHAAAQ